MELPRATSGSKVLIWSAGEACMRMNVGDEGVDCAATLGTDAKTDKPLTAPS